MKDFFISYRSSDRQWAEWIAAELELAGLSVEIQAWHFRDGNPVVKQINDALAAARATLAVLSPDYLTSKWCEMEWQAAIALETNGRDHRLLPICIEAGEFPPLLLSRSWVELFGLDEPTARQRLLQAARGDARRDPTKPVFPESRQTPTQTRSVSERPQHPRFPAALPKIWNVPLRNQNFTGRKKLLAALKKALAKGDATVLTQAIHGLGGVGKTQLAIEFAYRHSGDYDLVWWVASEQPEELKANFAALATQFDPRLAEVPQVQKLVEFARDVLEGKDPPSPLPLSPAAGERGWELSPLSPAAGERGWELSPLSPRGEGRGVRGEGFRWLVIFDNVEDPAHLDGCLPRGGGGHVIVTSRNQHFGNKAKTLEVKIFERKESLQFLHDRVAGVESSSPQHPIEAVLAPLYSPTGGSKTRPQPPDLADMLAVELGDLPLALAQAAAFMVETKTPFARYLELYRSRHADLWKDQSPPDDYRERVDTTWSLNIGEIDKQNPPVTALLNLCSFLAPDAIPRKMLVEQSKHLPGDLASLVLDDLKWANAIRLLGRFSLVESDGESITMHRVVQAVIRDRLAAAPSPQPLSPAAGERGEFSSSLSPAAGERGDILQTPLPAWGERGRGEGFAAAAVKIVNDAMPGDSLTNLATWPIIQQLLPHAKESATHAERLGIEPAATGRLLNQVGLYLRIRAEFVEAKNTLERAVRIGEQAFGPDHPDVATDVNNLGGVFQDLGDLPGARQAFERALKIGEQAFGPDHPQVASFVNNLGSVLRALGDLPGARQAFERALKIDEQAFGPDHPDVATDVNNLGLLLKDLGDLPGARRAYERALKIDEQAFGPDHPQVAIFVNNLGGVLQDLGDMPGARRAFERALGIVRKFLGDEHPNTLTVRGNLEAVKKLIGGKHEASE